MRAGIPERMHAIVLAGGRGERLRPFTADRPKAMVEIHGRPLLAYQIAWLGRQGVTSVTIACGYRHEVLQEHFGDGAAWGLRITYSVEDEPLGRGGALKEALRRLPAGEDPCLATNGDVLTDLELGPVVAAHRRAGMVATLVVTPLRSPYGIVDIGEGDRVRGFREKPDLPYWINAGIYVLSPQVGSLLPDRGDHEESTFPQLAAEGRLGAYLSRAPWWGVDTVKDLAEAGRAVEAGVLRAT